MRIQHRTADYIDRRGSITDLLRSEPVEHVALMVTKAGETRGQHYHERGLMHVYVLQGRFAVLARPAGQDDVDATSAIVERGDVVTFEPREVHALTALEDSVFLAMTHCPEGVGRFDDIVKEAV